MRWSVMLWVATAVTASASVKLYDVAPYRCENGFTSGGVGSHVSETFIACADSLLHAEVFFGQMPETLALNGYLVEVMDGNTPLYQGNATDTLQWAYVRATLSRQNPSVPFVRGKTYTLKVSHTGGQKINYFFDPRESTYAYGALARDQQVELQNDLVCRIYGVMNPVDSTYWDVGSPALTISV